MHLDHYCDSSSELSAFVEKFLPKAEVLCVAGDTSDNPKLFIDFYRLVGIPEKYQTEITNTFSILMQTAF